MYRYQKQIHAIMIDQIVFFYSILNIDFYRTGNPKEMAKRWCFFSCVNFLSIQKKCFFFVFIHHKSQIPVWKLDDKMMMMMMVSYHNLIIMFNSEYGFNAILLSSCLDFRNLSIFSWPLDLYVVYNYYYYCM